MRLSIAGRRLNCCAEWVVHQFFFLKTATVSPSFNPCRTSTPSVLCFPRMTLCLRKVPSARRTSTESVILVGLHSGTRYGSFAFESDFSLIEMTFPRYSAPDSSLSGPRIQMLLRLYVWPGFQSAAQRQQRRICQRLKRLHDRMEQCYRPGHQISEGLRR